MITLGVSVRATSLPSVGWAALERPRDPGVTLPPMICPECAAEYREGFTHCSDCDVDLVEAGAEEHDIELVSVFQSGNPAIIPIVDSLLRDAEIDFVTTGNSMQALQGGIGSPVVVPVEFWVRADDAAAAREILDAIERR